MAAAVRHRSGAVGPLPSQWPGDGGRQAEVRHCACHLPAQARLLERLAGEGHGLDFTPFAVGWQQTTVAGDAWLVRDTPEGDSRPCDLSKDADHFFLYEEEPKT
jgi:hypothetical protein